MRRLLFAAFAGASLLTSAVAFADDTKPVSPTPATTTPNDADKQVCKPVTHEGEVVGQTCHTQREWDRMNFQNQQSLRQYQQQSLYGNPH